MFRMFLFGVLLMYATAAQAQPAQMPGTHMEPHMQGTMHDGHAGVMAPAAVPHEPGQAAFAAIQEIVEMLWADPSTDWSKVDIEALRRHLIDMDNVTLRSHVTATPVEEGGQKGMRFVVTGTGAVRDSIARMVRAHAATMSGRNGMTITAGDNPDGAVMTVTVANPADFVKLKALGFIGVMTLGMHHQVHHLAIATGHAPHP